VAKNNVVCVTCEKSKYRKIYVRVDFSTHIEMCLFCVEFGNMIDKNAIECDFYKKDILFK
jgi:hypothetical protein